MATKKTQAQIDKLAKKAKALADDDGVSLEEFGVFVKTITDYLAGIKGKIDEVDALRDALKKEAEYMRSLTNTYTGHKKTIDQGLSHMEKRVGEIKNGRDGLHGRNGKDADPKKVIEMVRNLAPKGMTPAQLKAFEDLEDLVKEALEDLKKVKNRGMQIMGGTSGRSLFHDVDISSQLDGVTKTFTLSAFYMIISVYASSHPYALRKGVDYTFDGNAGTITFTDQITASASLAAGQTVILTIVNA